VLTVFATSLVNLVFVGPATTKIMLERRRQGGSILKSLRGCAKDVIRVQGWEEVLRSSAPLKGNAEPEQGLWIDAWRLIIAEYGGLDSHHMVWRNSCREIAINPERQGMIKYMASLVMLEVEKKNK
jgi:hypothetical protein